MKLSQEEHLIQQAICRSLTSALVKRGIKQEAIAETLGMRQSHLSEKLRGKNGLQVSFLIKLALATGIPISELLSVELLDPLINTKASSNSWAKQHHVISIHSIHNKNMPDDDGNNEMRV